MAQGMLPSFFKIFDPSIPYMPLPPVFARKQLKNRIPEDHSILQSVNGGVSWSLKIRIVDESYSFVDGWHKVVQDTRLVSGDLLVFWLVDQSTFKVLIFSKNGCQKVLPSKIMVGLDDNEEEEEEDDGVSAGDDEEEEEEDDDDDDDDDDDEEEEEEDDDEDDKNDVDPFFETTISKFHTCHLGRFG